MLESNQMSRAFARLVVYALLLLGAALFIFPLIWMLSTALKPIDQTLEVPPTWIPYRLYAEIDGERMPVKRRGVIEEPSYLVREKDSEVRRIVSRVRYAGEAQEMTIIREIPAAPGRKWVKVIPEFDSDAEWRVVPVSSLMKRCAPRWGNFVKAIKAMKHFGDYLRNTLVLCFLTVVGTVFSSALAAYGFSRIAWKGRDKVFLLALATMMVPFPVVMVPIYSMFRLLGWIGTLRPLWIGSFFAGAFNVFLLRQFFMTIPKDLSDAARIDGCSEFRIFWQIMLPLCKPALMVVGLFQFMATWNDFLGPLIYLTDQKDFTLALGLQFLQSQHGGTEWHYLMAASAIIVAPIIVLFFFTQKSFIEGISMTGLKG